MNLSPDRALGELCRRSFYRFVQEFWHIIIPEDPVWNWHIEYLCKEAQIVVERIEQRLPKEYDLIINIPPGTSKSTIWTVMLPVWSWTRDERIRSMTASYSSTLSTDHSVKSRDILRSQKFKDLFPEIQLKQDQDNKTHYKNTKGGERYATSVGGAITGFHAHLIIVDDPLNPKGAASDAERATANSFMDVTLSTRKVDKKLTPTILVMQRLHEEDCTGNWFKKKKNIKHICLPGELSKDVNPPELREMYQDGLMDPIRMDDEALTDLHQDLGSYGYAGQIMQTPSPEGGGIWDKWIIPVKRNQIPRLQRHGKDWDLAYTKNDKNSASAYLEAGIVGNDMYITDFDYRYLEFPDLINWMRSKSDNPHYIEAKASGKSAKQVLKSQGIVAIEVDVSGSEGDKIARTRMATPFAEAGFIYCAEDILERLYNDSKQGILKFPNTGTDVNDTLVQAINRLLKRTKTKVKKSSVR